MDLIVHRLLNRPKLQDSLVETRTVAGTFEINKMVFVTMLMKPFWLNHRFRFFLAFLVSRTSFRPIFLAQ